ncbi:hypothetical protein [Campylobacter geochelonis]|uniref:Mobilization protein n=1 Tax=Campylobacter geochelonis TaxID=1780362 RepID=A0A128EHG5_9BACT|nr:hypothetical protein [Campylobacter geochelonis]QKF71360.1 hypothetical protein CGEO_1048 [Campylobacter geochelonis]CZE48274.1 mobilization protein [Campylobacter geochelonis]
MARKSCIAFQKSSKMSFFHNAREGFKAKTVYPELSCKNEIMNDSFDSTQLFNLMYNEAKNNYITRTNQKMQVKKENLIWEAVVNTNKNTSFEQLQKVAELVEKKLGYRTLQIAHHLDEGHIDEQGNFITNYHAHLVFFTLDKNGKSLCSKHYKNKQLFRDLQTEVAEILRMERGQENSKARRLEHREYKRLKQATSPLEAKIEQLENELKTILNTPNIDTQLLIENLQNENKTLTKKLAKAQIKALREQLKAQNAELRGILRENKAGRADYGGLEGQVNEVKFELDKLESKLKTQNHIEENDVNNIAKQIENLHLPANFKVREPDKISKILGLDI